MPEVIRKQMLRVLAEKGMGWHFLEEEDPVELRHTHPKRQPRLYAYRKNGHRLYLEWWRPDINWEHAGELLEAMQHKPVLWRLFVEGVCDASTGIMGKADVTAVLKSLTPALIAEAAYDALRE